MSQTPGYNDLDLMARQTAMQTLVLVLIAKHVGVLEDSDASAWLKAAEDNARSTLIRLERQAEERINYSLNPVIVADRGEDT